MLSERKRAYSEVSPLGLPGFSGGAGADSRSSLQNRRSSMEKSRSETHSPCSSSSTCLRSSSMPYLSTNTLMRALARFARSHSWRSKMRMTASVMRK